MYFKKMLQSVRRTKSRLDPRLRRYKLPGPARARTPLEVGIVGGGIAGLAAAWALRRLGHDVHVFEAQDRPGGRIHTVGIGSHVVEAGAARFSDRHLRALYWIDMLGLGLEPMYPAQGRLVRLEGSRRAIGQDAASLSSDDVHLLVSEPSEWNGQFGSRASRVRNLIVNSLSRPTWYRIKGGNAQLPRRIAQELGDAVSYHSPVTAIHQNERHVEISYLRDGEAHTRRFDRCILATPPTTHDDIDIRPALSDSKVKHAGETTTQPAARTFVLLRDRSVIERERLSGFGSTDEGFEIWQPSFSSGSGDMTLVFYAQGEAARPLIDLDDASRDQLSMEMLERVFPGVQERTVETKTYCWVSNPWARGAQTLFRGDVTLARTVMGRPEGRLHFAGEHTSGGWVENALASADRVVEEICAT